MNRFLCYLYSFIAVIGALVAASFSEYLLVFICLGNSIVGLLLLVITERHHSFHHALRSLHKSLHHTIWTFLQYGWFFFLYGLLLWYAANVLYFGSHIVHFLFVFLMLLLLIRGFWLDYKYKKLRFGMLTVGREFFRVFPVLVWSLWYTVAFGLFKDDGGIMMLLLIALIACVVGAVITNNSVKSILSTVPVVLLSFGVVLWLVYGLVTNTTKWPQTAKQTVPISQVDRVVYMPINTGKFSCPDTDGRCPNWYCLSKNNFCIQQPAFADCTPWIDQWWICQEWYDQVVNRCIQIEQGERLE